MFTPIGVAMEILVPLYNSPQRHYHDLNHINFCISKLQEVLSQEEYHNWLRKKDTMFALTNAIYFHDAIYSPYPNVLYSNERMSGTLFENHVYEHSDLYINQVFEGDRSRLEKFVKMAQEAIFATEYHMDLTKYPNELSHPHTTKIVLDIDLSGFAKSFGEVYKDSDRIFKEYECLGLPHITLLTNRIKFLKALLAKESIFHTNYFKLKYEATARANIEAVVELSEAELASLG